MSNYGCYGWYNKPFQWHGKIILEAGYKFANFERCIAGLTAAYSICTQSQEISNQNFMDCILAKCDSQFEPETEENRLCYAVVQMNNQILKREDALIGWHKAQDTGCAICNMNGKCEEHERYETCPDDCICNKNGVCDSATNEDYINCPSDCVNFAEVEWVSRRGNKDLAAPRGYGSYGDWLHCYEEFDSRMSQCSLRLDASVSDFGICAKTVCTQFYHGAELNECEALFKYVENDILFSLLAINTFKLTHDVCGACKSGTCDLFDGETELGKCPHDCVRKSLWGGLFDAPIGFNMVEGVQVSNWIPCNDELDLCFNTCGNLMEDCLLLWNNCLKTGCKVYTKMEGACAQRADEMFPMYAADPNVDGAYNMAQAAACGVSTRRLSYLRKGGGSES